MSLRDNPESSKIIVPLVAGLAINRAYDPSSGGIGGPGRDRTTLPEKWVTQPGVDPAILCNNDPETDPYLALWFDAKDTDTLVLAPKEYDEETGKLLQRRVLEWKDKSRFHRNAVAVLPKYAPKLSQQQPFFDNAVDFAPVCIDPTSDETDPSAGGGGDPPPENCTDTTLIRSCGVNTIAVCESWDWELMKEAKGDWRTGAGKAVVLASAGNFEHSVEIPDTEDFTLLGAWCPAAARGLPGYDVEQAIATRPDTGEPWRGMIYNADPGKDGSVQIVLAGFSYPYTSNTSQDFLLWFKDIGRPVNDSPFMAGRHVRVSWVRPAWWPPAEVPGTAGGVIGTGTVNAKGQVDWCRCCIEPMSWYNFGSDIPGECMYTIEIAEPGAPPFTWTTQDCVGECGSSCGYGDHRPNMKIRP